MSRETEHRIRELLQQRKEKGEYRKLSTKQDLIDFSSNDYLGLSRSAWIADRVNATLHSKNEKMGSTGSRLLTGNSEALEELEREIARFHNAEAALLLSSGFAANEGLIETVCRSGDIILFDSAVHASVHQGVKLSKAQSFAFDHNDIDHLSRLLNEHQKPGAESAIFVIIESVYSMDGDHAPLEAIAALKKDIAFNLIVDEAHALGVFGKQGRGLCDEAGICSSCFARVYTFGKGLGSHGAVIVGSETLRDYLVNFCKPFIYSTAPDSRFTATVKHSYYYILKFDYQINKLIYLIKKFKLSFSELKNFEIIGDGPVFGLICGSPERARSTAVHLNKEGFDVRPIVYPTVARGSERIRISLHSFNSEAELESLFESLKNYAI